MKLKNQKNETDNKLKNEAGDKLKTGVLKTEKKEVKTRWKIKNWIDNKMRIWTKQAKNELNKSCGNKYCITELIVAYNQKKRKLFLPERFPFGPEFSQKGIG